MRERRWKLVELARQAGITEQQVRNYLAAGLLPPAGRAANNYRVFTDQHADALRTVRAVAAGHGWARARGMLTAVHRGDVRAALATLDESHAELARERATVAAAIQAFTRAARSPAPAGSPRPAGRLEPAGRLGSAGGVEPAGRLGSAGSPEPAARRPARIGEVAAMVGVRTPVLRLWEQRGLLRPERDRSTGYRTYSPAEQRAAHLVAVLRAGGFAFALIEGALAAVRASGSLDQALARLAEREEQLHQASVLRLRGSAALHAYLTAHF